ncbi:hypothetical protein [Coprothermobacter platensis]|nr:hypothetical protein [Coprothermobacter platensis]
MRELQAVLKFAQKRIDGASGKTKDKIQQVIDFISKQVVAILFVG